MTSRRRRRALSLEELDLWLASDRAPAKAVSSAGTPGSSFAPTFYLPDCP